MKTQNILSIGFRLAAKVSELLDSFRPGSYSYRPFKKASQSSRGGTTWSRRHRTVPNPPQNQLPVSPDPLILDRPDPEAPIIPQSPFNTRFQDLDGVRRRLYVDLGRPRPFYRRRPSNNSLGKGLDLIASNSATPASLEVRLQVIRWEYLGHIEPCSRIWSKWVWCNAWDWLDWKRSSLVRSLLWCCQSWSRKECWHSFVTTLKKSWSQVKREWNLHL